MTSWLRATLTMFLASRLGGCSAAHIEVRNHPLLPRGTTIKVGGEKFIAKHCVGIEKKDNGDPWGPNEFPDACYDPSTMTIYVPPGDDGILRHEACHAWGLPSIQCDMVH